MHWYCRVYDEMDDWTAYCVWAPSEHKAFKRLGAYITDVEGYTAEHIDCVPWNTYDHGDINDYEVLS